jgi:hypothetical protein
MNKIRVLTPATTKVRPAAIKVGTAAAQENLRRAMDASAKLREYVRNEGSRLFPEKRKSK